MLHFLVFIFNGSMGDVPTLPFEYHAPQGHLRTFSGTSNVDGDEVEDTNMLYPPSSAPFLTLPEKKDPSDLSYTELWNHLYYRQLFASYMPSSPSYSCPSFHMKEVGATWKDGQSDEELFIRNPLCRNVGLGGLHSNAVGPSTAVLISSVKQEKHTLLSKILTAFQHAYSQKKILLSLFREQINPILEQQRNPTHSHAEEMFFLQFESTLTQVGDRALRFYYPQCVAEAEEPEIALRHLKEEWKELLKQVCLFVKHGMTTPSTTPTSILAPTRSPPLPPLLQATDFPSSSPRSCSCFSCPSPSSLSCSSSLSSFSASGSFLPSGLHGLSPVSMQCVSPVHYHSSGSPCAIREEGLGPTPRSFPVFSVSSVPTSPAPTPPPAPLALPGFFSPSSNASSCTTAGLTATPVPFTPLSTLHLAQRMANPAPPPLSLPISASSFSVHHRIPRLESDTATSPVVGVDLSWKNEEEAEDREPHRWNSVEAPSAIHELQNTATNEWMPDPSPAVHVSPPPTSSSSVNHTATTGTAVMAMRSTPLTMDNPPPPAGTSHISLPSASSPVLERTSSEVFTAGGGGGGGITVSFSSSSFSHEHPSAMEYWAQVQRERLQAVSSVLQSLELFERYHTIQTAVQEAQLWLEWYQEGFPSWDRRRRKKARKRQEKRNEKEKLHFHGQNPVTSGPRVSSLFSSFPSSSAPPARADVVRAASRTSSISRSWPSSSWSSFSSCMSSISASTTTTTSTFSTTLTDNSHLRSRSTSTSTYRSNSRKSSETWKIASTKRRRKKRASTLERRERVEWTRRSPLPHRHMRMSGVNEESDRWLQESLAKRRHEWSVPMNSAVDHSSSTIPLTSRTTTDTSSLLGEPKPTTVEIGSGTTGDKAATAILPSATSSIATPNEDTHCRSSSGTSSDRGEDGQACGVGSMELPLTFSPSVRDSIVRTASPPPPSPANVVTEVGNGLQIEEDAMGLGGRYPSNTFSFSSFDLYGEVDDEEEHQLAIWEQEREARRQREEEERRSVCTGGGPKPLPNEGNAVACNHEEEEDWDTQAEGMPWASSFPYLLFHETPPLDTENIVMKWKKKKKKRERREERLKMGKEELQAVSHARSPRRHTCATHYHPHFHHLHSHHHLYSHHPHFSSTAVPSEAIEEGLPPPTTTMRTPTPIPCTEGGVAAVPQHTSVPTPTHEVGKLDPHTHVPEEKGVQGIRCTATTSCERFSLSPTSTTEREKEGWTKPKEETAETLSTGSSCFPLTATAPACGTSSVYSTPHAPLSSSPSVNLSVPLSCALDSLLAEGDPLIPRTPASSFLSFSPLIPPSCTRTRSTTPTMGTANTAEPSGYTGAGVPPQGINDTRERDLPSVSHLGLSVEGSSTDTTIAIHSEKKGIEGAESSSLPLQSVAPEFFSSTEKGDTTPEGTSPPHRSPSNGTHSVDSGETRRSRSNTTNKATTTFTRQSARYLRDSTTIHFCHEEDSSSKGEGGSEWVTASRSSSPPLKSSFTSSSFFPSSLPFNTPSLKEVLRRISATPFPRLPFHLDMMQFASQRQSVEMLRLQRRMAVVNSANEELRKRKGA